MAYSCFRDYCWCHHAHCILYVFWRSVLPNNPNNPNLVFICVLLLCLYDSFGVWVAGVALTMIGGLIYFCLSRRVALHDSNNYASSPGHVSLNDDSVYVDASSPFSSN